MKAVTNEVLKVYTNLGVFAQKLQRNHILFELKYSDFTKILVGIDYFFLLIETLLPGLPHQIP